MKNSTSLTIEMSAGMPAPGAAEALALCVFSDAPRGPGDRAAGLIENLLLDGEFKGDAETTLLLHTQQSD
ncbi:MAG: hypothetical protein H7Y30_03985, partial [Pyrinomonadaceae bacterium]|nr:hypothetical protein [Pyrinomonadaceae bacterium]